MPRLSVGVLAHRSANPYLQPVRLQIFSGVMLTSRYRER